MESPGLALVDDLNIMAVRIKDPGRIVARIVFEPGSGRFLALSSGCQGGLVERINFGMVFRHKAHVNRLGIGLPLLEPEKKSLAIAETPQIRVSAFSFVRRKVGDSKWFQSLGIEGRRTPEVTNGENDVVYHVLPSGRPRRLITSACLRAPDRRIPHGVGSPVQRENLLHRR